MQKLGRDCRRLSISASVRPNFDDYGLAHPSVALTRSQVSPRVHLTPKVVGKLARGCAAAIAEVQPRWISPRLRRSTPRLLPLRKSGSPRCRRARYLRGILSPVLFEAINPHHSRAAFYTECRLCRFASTSLRRLAPLRRQRLGRRRDGTSPLDSVNSQRQPKRPQSVSHAGRQRTCSRLRNAWHNSHL